MLLYLRRKLTRVPQIFDRCTLLQFFTKYGLYLGSHVAMTNSRSKMAHLTAGLYISNVRRSTIGRNNDTTYFEPSIFVHVHVHFVIPLTNVWQLFTLRSNLSSESLFSTYFGFHQLSFRYNNGHIPGTTHQILTNIGEFSILVVIKLMTKCH